MAALKAMLVFAIMALFAATTYAGCSRFLATTDIQLPGTYTTTYWCYDANLNITCPGAFGNVSFDVVSDNLFIYFHFGYSPPSQPTCNGNGFVSLYKNSINSELRGSGNYFCTGTDVYQGLAKLSIAFECNYWFGGCTLRNGSTAVICSPFMLGNAVVDLSSSSSGKWHHVERNKNRLHRIPLQ